MQFDESGATLAENMGVTVSKMQDSVEAHLQTSLKTAGYSAPPFLDTSGIRALAVRAESFTARKPSMTDAASPRATPH